MPSVRPFRLMAAQGAMVGKKAVDSPAVARRFLQFVLFALFVTSLTLQGQAQINPPGPLAFQPADRVTEPVDDTARVRLRDNVNRLARPEFDQGPVLASYP